MYLKLNSMIYLIDSAKQMGFFVMFLQFLLFQKCMYMSVDVYIYAHNYLHYFLDFAIILRKKHIPFRDVTNTKI